jgi:hypothetical protein
MIFFSFLSAGQDFAVRCNPSTRQLPESSALLVVSPCGDARLQRQRIIEQLLTRSVDEPPRQLFFWGFIRTDETKRFLNGSIFLYLVLRFAKILLEACCGDCGPTSC